jgi:hypothetical protein
LLVGDMNIDEIGCYVVQDKKHLNKYEALETSFKKSSSISFNFNNDFWNTVDWKNPSTKSLRELYRNRALSLRQKYDYIILCYSGGADSYNAMRSFGDNKIHLDEIVSWHDYSITENKESFASAEVFNVGVKEAEKFIRHNPRTVFTLLDIKEPLIESLSNIEEKDYIHWGQSSCSIAYPIRGGDWIYQGSKYTKLIEQGKKICLLSGYDKTALSIKEGRYCFQFHDMITRSNRKQIIRPDLPVHDEFFYWSPDSAEMIVKQCHIIKTYLDFLPNNYIDPHSLNLEAAKYRTAFFTNKKGVAVSFPTLNSWLYDWDPKTFTVGKPRGTPGISPYFVSEMDWWVQKYLNEDVTKKWLKQLRFSLDYYKKVKSINRDRYNPAFGDTPLLLTQPYFIE